MQRDITDAFLRTITPPGAGRLEIWDTRAPGLVLRVTATGSATWSVRARTADGKRTRPKIGTWPALGIAEARKRARALSVHIDGGGDPIAEKRAARVEREQRAALPTVAEKLAQWQDHKQSSWSPRYAAEVARIAAREIGPVLGKRPLRETVRTDWTALVTAKRKTAPSMASLIYRVCAAFLGHAEAHGWIDTSLLPRKGLAVLAAPPEARDRVLTDAELRGIWHASERLRPKPRAFIRLLIATAARETEVADIATGEIDLDRARWTIPGGRTKNGEPITLPLPDALLGELRALWPEHDAGAGWKLLGAIAGSGLRGFSKLKVKIDAESGVAGWRWHDLRRTARSGMARLGVPQDHAEAAINHISGRSALVRTYDRHDYADEVIAALERWQAHVEATVHAGAPTETTDFRSAS